MRIEGLGSGFTVSGLGTGNLEPRTKGKRAPLGLPTLKALKLQKIQVWGLRRFGFRIPGLGFRL